MTQNAIFEDSPEVGYYWRRYHRNGPKLPAMIWDASPRDEDTGELIGDEKLCCIIDGRAVDIKKNWTWIAGNPISKKDYDALVRARLRSPEILAHKPVDLTKMDPITP